MKSIAIVGAGQSGLQLALSLLRLGYEVRMISNRTADQIREGKVMSSQCMFDDALKTERELGLNWWDGDCPRIDTFGIAVAHPEQRDAKLIDWFASLDSPAQSVDQRVKMSAWLNEFERRGGRVVIENAGIDELEEYARSHDLVIVAAGKGDIVKLFERDAARSPYDRPQRAIALTYLRGVLPRTPELRWCAVPGIGELVVFPGLTTTGPCHILSWFGIPGGPMDCWGDAQTPERHLAKVKELTNTFFPWETESFRDIELTDANGFLSGGFAPTVRKPVATLPSGRAVLGMADVVVVNDPINGQGSNNAAKCATSYLKSIVELAEGRPTSQWMQQIFDRFWSYARPVTEWTNAILAPPTPHVLNLLGAAGNMPGVARAIVNAFNHPPSIHAAWMDATECERFIQEHAVAA
jgi:hypothetical protein